MSENCKPVDNTEIHQALGAFILAVASLEALLIHAIAAMVEIPPGKVGYLLNKTNGRAKVDFLKNSFKEKGIEIDLDLKKALKKLHTYMDIRNDIVHDPIIFYSNRGHWARLQGKLLEDAEMGFEKHHLDPKKLTRDSQDIWEINKIIGEKVLIPYGEFKYG